MDDRPTEEIVDDFISSLQWDLRASYNSSSCLNEKQSAFLRESLTDLLDEQKGD